MIVVFFVALLLRTNLPVIIALQWISNPFTMGPIYYADYQIGLIFFKLVGIEYKSNVMLSPHFNWNDFSFSDLINLLDAFPPMLMGGSIIGISLGVASVFLYKVLSRTYKIKDDGTNFYK